MKRFIHVTKEDRKFLEKAFGVSSVTVWKALKFEEDTETIRKIQTVAKKRGGVVMVVIPEVETLHDHDNVTRQYFPNGALVELDHKDGRGYVIFNGETVRTYENVAVKEIDSIHAYAAALR